MKFFTEERRRDLKLPIGMVGNEKRALSFRKRFSTMDLFATHPQYFYGSHYSSPAIVLHYLIRLRPYEKGSKAIQNGVFDLPDRLFFSMNSLEKNIMEEMSDVRELIPEMFYLPAMFLNLNNFDFGVNQSKQRVHNVIMPVQADTPAKLVFDFRATLEDSTTSERLGEWLDLVFGFKQQGPSAIEAANLFFYLTYESSMADVSREDAKTRIASETQIYHFG